MIRKFVVAVLFALVPVSCMGTTLADRMPLAAKSIRSVLDSVNDDLDMAKEELAKAELSAAARDMLRSDSSDLATRIAETHQVIERAEKELDTRMLENATVEINTLGQLVSAYHRSILIASAAAGGK